MRSKSKYYNKDISTAIKKIKIKYNSFTASTYFSNCYRLPIFRKRKYRSRKQ